MHAGRSVRFAPSDGPSSHHDSISEDAHEDSPSQSQSVFQGAFFRLVKECDLEGLEKLFGNSNRFEIDPNAANYNDTLHPTAAHICCQLGAARCHWLARSQEASSFLGEGS